MVAIRRIRLLVVLLGAPLVFLVVLRTVPALDAAFFDAQGHLVIVSLIAACALVTALVAATSAVRSQHPGAVWLGVGLAAVGVFMVGHGLLTPGQFDRPRNLWVSRFPHLAMFCFGAGIILASSGPDRLLNRWVRRRPLAVTVGLLVPMGALVALVVRDERLLWGVGAIPREDDVFDLVSVVTVAMLLVGIRTHWKRWALGRDIIQFALVLASAMSIAAVTAFQHGRFGQLSWWDYHGFLLAGFGAATFAVFQRTAGEHAITDIIRHAFADDPFSHIERGYPETLRSLVRAVEIKDAYTHGHSERTARLAVEIGLRMRLAPDRLRVIARGAYLHDLGKIGIPDHILNKPAALTPEERAVIETHPTLGYEMASTAPSLAEALPVILHHHERVDGCGYPAGLAGTAIPLEARVVAVADVWDALTSARAYRPGWTAERALAHIEAGVGSHFDPVTVDALKLLTAEWGVAAGTDGVAEEAWSAAETCHEIDARGALVTASTR